MSRILIEEVYNQHYWAQFIKEENPLGGPQANGEAAMYYALK